jgi:hypothetical protein
MATEHATECKREHSLVYYQKPCIGDERGVRTAPPVQLVFPGGGFGLGIPVKDADEVLHRGATNNFAVLASAPERASHDLTPLRGLQATFVVLAIVNLTITSAIYFNADSSDTSRVSPELSPTVGAFEEVSSNRRPVEDVDYAFTVIILVLGTMSAILESGLGVSAYCLATLLNFILGTSALPYFVYSTRYILDMFMLYFALVLRSRLICSFLPLHLRSISTTQV